jgi:glucosamine--fructose-6-phosphate aminotransferase (isomerizing)
MCGIIGYVGKNNSIPILIKSLKNLEYRGYDSAGISYVVNNKIKIVKEKGKIVELEKKINYEDNSNIGIGHTRWATHGKANKINAHPHHQGDITIVHNGIIENYIELKNDLENNGYKFKSETDSEVACAYIDYAYKKEKDILKALNECIKVFKGSYAIAVIVKNDYDNLYVLKKESPLIIGIGKEQNFVASDVPAIINYTNKYITLEDKEYAVISANNICVYKNNKLVSKEVKEFSYNISNISKDNYEHYMLKEIHEQPKIIDNLVSKYFKDNKFNMDLLPEVKHYQKIYIVGCGSAYHASVVGKYLIEEYGDIEVNVELASEFRYKKLFLDSKSLVIAISQSGETADTLASLKIAKEMGCHTIGIVNVYESSIARFVDDVIYTEAGSEIAVATTKGYLTQVFILGLLALKLGLQNNKTKNIEEIIKYYNSISDKIDKLVNTNYQDLAYDIYQKNDIFFLGRNIDYALMLEASLKLKEISYIHSECYAAGELKHGTISLIEKNTPVLALITNDVIADKTISNIKEVIARGAYVILIAKDSLDIPSCYNKKITIPNTINLLQPLLNIIPLQLLSYEIAKLRKCDIDKPRNLAKSVTVE